MNHLPMKVSTTGKLEPKHEVVRDTWKALAYSALGYTLVEQDASLYCDYSCLRGGCRDGKCQVWTVNEPIV